MCTVAVYTWMTIKVFYSIQTKNFNWNSNTSNTNIFTSKCVPFFPPLYEIINKGPGITDGNTAAFPPPPYQLTNKDPGDGNTSSLLSPSAISGRSPAAASSPRSQDPGVNMQRPTEKDSTAMGIPLLRHTGKEPTCLSKINNRTQPHVMLTPSTEK